jgi:AcrR family transcriptional regulator
VPRKRPVSEYPEGARRKAAIIQAATKFFALNGYRDASLASIASAAGLTQPGLLHHFPSKPELLLAVLRDRERRDKTLVADAIKANQDDVVGLLNVLVAHNAAEQSETLLHTVISAEATSPSHPAHEFFVNRYTRVRKALTRSIGKQAAGSDMTEDQITALATICMAVMDGLQIAWLLDPEIDMAKNFEVFGDIMRRAIASSADVTGAEGKPRDR